jgi:hypothetical protein
MALTTALRPGGKWRDGRSMKHAPHAQHHVINNHLVDLLLRTSAPLSPLKPQQRLLSRRLPSPITTHFFLTENSMALLSLLGLPLRFLVWLTLLSSCHLMKGPTLITLLLLSRLLSLLPSRPILLCLRLLLCLSSLTLGHPVISLLCCLTSSLFVPSSHIP